MAQRYSSNGALVTEGIRNEIGFRIVQRPGKPAQVWAQWPDGSWHQGLNRKWKKILADLNAQLAAQANA